VAGEFVTEIEVMPPPSPDEVHQTLKELTWEVEARVRDAYARTLGARNSPGLALAAVGGFGREELFPCSDIDLLLLVGSEKMMPPKELIAQFLQILWDCKLRPSHSVHTVADCVAETPDNPEFTISLLDRRFLLGDAAVFETLRKDFSLFLKKKGV